MIDLPFALIQSLRSLESFNEKAFKSVHEQGMQITSVRLNPEKFRIQNSKFKTDEAVPWSSNGYYLNERPSFTLDPLFHAGAYYVQEASSMFLEEAIKQTADLAAPLRILDLCAAPGGKSTLIQSIISKESMLVSNEVIKTRVNILSENISKWGAANVIVTNNDPKDFQRLNDFFDMIVVDAPCSGSGLFRKDPQAIAEWSENSVTLCARRQQRILADVLPALKEGGVLIYSTCSYSQQEDEEIADWLLELPEMESIKLKTGQNWSIVETASTKYNAPGYRFYPDKLKGEGFFIAVFRKKLTGKVEERIKGKKAKISADAVTGREKEVLKKFLNNAGGFIFYRQQNDILAVPANIENDFALIRSSLYLKKAGVKMGAIIRDELVPEHELAVSSCIHDSVTRFDVDEETALQYLRRKEIRIDTDYKGWALITCRQLPLGWIKLLANRINNYYPAAWRILNR